jgi:hypothetical protein
VADGGYGFRDASRRIDRSSLKGSGLRILTLRAGCAECPELAYLESNQFWLCGCRGDLDGESEVLESIDQAQNVLAFSALVEVGSA